MNPKYIPILIGVVIIVAGVLFLTLKKDTPVPVVPIEVTATSTPEVAPVATSTTVTATTTTTTPAPKPVVTPKPTPAPVVTPTPAPTVKAYSLTEIALHTSKTDCWTAIYEKVYDITSYIPRHPGGESQIMKVCGKDGTYLFVDQHDNDKKPNAKLATFMIADLAK